MLPNTTFYNMIKTFHAQNRNFRIRPLVETISNPIIDRKTLFPIAELSMKILQFNDYGVTEKGVYYADHQYPSASDNKLYSSGGFLNTVYDFNTSNLSFDTDYYYRGFAENSDGVGFGDVLSFRTHDTEWYSEAFYVPLPVGNTKLGIDFVIWQTYIDNYTSLDQLLFIVSKNLSDIQYVIDTYPIPPYGGWTLPEGVYDYFPGQVDINGQSDLPKYIYTRYESPFDIGDTFYLAWYVRPDNSSIPRNWSDILAFTYINS